VTPSKLGVRPSGREGSGTFAEQTRKAVSGTARRHRGRALVKIEFSLVNQEERRVSYGNKSRDGACKGVEGQASRAKHIRDFQAQAEPA